MKILSYILSFSVFISSFTPLNSYAVGAGEDPFYECRPSPTGDIERQEQKIKFLDDSAKLKDDEVKAKEDQLKVLKGELEEVSKLVQKTDKNTRDTSVIDRKQAVIDRIYVVEEEIKNIRAQQSVQSEELKNAQLTLNAQKERDKLTNSNIEIFTLTTGELRKESVAGQVADTSLQLMALATSGLAHLDCTPASRNDSTAYHVFKAASGAYLTNNLTEVMDYENLAECVTKKALSPTEKKDVQFTLIKRARDLFNEMEKHVDSVIETTGTDLELFSKALQYATSEWAGKLEKVATSYEYYKVAKDNYEDAYKLERNIRIAAIALTVSGFGFLAGLALFIYWGVEAKPKLISTKAEFKKTERELRLSHQFTSLKCNYREARSWNLNQELESFKVYLTAKKKAEDAARAEEEARIKLYKKLEQEKKGRDREGSKPTSTSLFFESKKLNASLHWTKYLIDNLFAQDEEVLEGALTKIQETYSKATATEGEDAMKGSIAVQGDSSSRIPPFKPGTPQGKEVVENLEKRYENFKNIYLRENNAHQRLQSRLDGLMKDYEDYAEKFGKVAEKDPEIKCPDQYPFTYYRTSTLNWDNTPQGQSWRRYWREKGCSKDNKNTLKAKGKVINDFYGPFLVSETRMELLERQMDAAELDFLTAQQINEGADGSDPYGDNLNPQGNEMRAFADFIGKIKAEWKTSSIDSEKDNFVLVNRTSQWTLERLLNEHVDIKNLPANKKAGFSDPYTRYIYTQYAVDLVIKKIELLSRAKSIAHGQSMAYQELLSQASSKLGLDAVALPQGNLEIKKKKACLKGSGEADPTCSCKARGNCKTFSFPAAVLAGSSKDLSSGLVQDYVNETFSAGDGARVKGDGMKRNAAITKDSIDQSKSIIMAQRKGMEFQNTDIGNMSETLGEAIKGDARRSAAAAISSDTKVGRNAKIQALKEKIEPAVLASPTASISNRQVFKKAEPKKKEQIEMGELSIDETGLAVEGELEEESLDYGLKKGKAETKGAAKSSSDSEAPVGIEQNPGKPIWKIVTDRYHKSGFKRLLEKKPKN